MKELLKRERYDHRLKHVYIVISCIVSSFMIAYNVALIYYPEWLKRKTNDV